MYSEFWRVWSMKPLKDILNWIHFFTFTDTLFDKISKMTETKLIPVFCFNRLLSKLQITKFAFYNIHVLNKRSIYFIGSDISRIFQTNLFAHKTFKCLDLHWYHPPFQTFFIHHSLNPEIGHMLLIIVIIRRKSGQKTTKTFLDSMLRNVISKNDSRFRANSNTFLCLIQKYYFVLIDIQC